MKLHRTVVPERGNTGGEPGEGFQDTAQGEAQTEPRGLSVQETRRRETKQPEVTWQNTREARAAQREGERASQHSQDLRGSPPLPVFSWA